MEADKSEGRYDDIIHLPHHVSKTRPQMPISDRAAQFASFDALTGYEAVIRETARLTDERIELDDEALSALDMRYQLLADAQEEQPEITITFFQADRRKEGGAYLTVTGTVKKVDVPARQIVMHDGAKISMEDVLAIDGALFSVLE